MDYSLDTVMEWLSRPFVTKSLSALVAIIISIIVVRIVQRIATRYIADKNMRYRARKTVGFIGYLIAFLILAIVFSDRLGRISIIFGVAGAGVAFALQEVIASIAGWAAVSLGGFYKVGDRVQLGGIKGDVIDIGLLRTTLMEVGAWVNGDLYNGRVVRIANSFVFKEPVFGYSGDFPFLWDEIQVPIRFSSDLKYAHKILQDAADEVTKTYLDESAKIWKEIQRRFPLEDASTKPFVTLAFDHNWVTFTLRYTVRFDKRRTTKHELFTRILDDINRSNGEVSIAASAMEIFPKAVFHVEGASH